MIENSSRKQDAAAALGAGTAAAEHRARADRAAADQPHARDGSSPLPTRTACIVSRASPGLRGGTRRAALLAS